MHSPQRAPVEVWVTLKLLSCSWPRAWTITPGVYVNTVHRTATRNVLNTLRNVQPVHPNNQTRLVCSPFNRTREKTLSGVDLSPRLRNSRRIHMARFSGPGDHSGPISDHFRRFGHFGPDPYMRLQHWHSTLAFSIGIQH